MRHDQTSRQPAPAHKTDAATSAPAPFVLVHGGWHNQSAWKKLAPLLAANGHAVFALDLPGAGAKTVLPKSLAACPFDSAAFANEPSPVAAVTLDERVEAVLEAVKEAYARHGLVVLVGHSAGGVVVSEVAERVPDLLAATVYLAGFMLAPGLSLLDMLSHEAMATALSPGLFVGDPLATGATRINPMALDGNYRALLKASFYGDATDADFAEAAAQLHTDEPNGGAVAPSRITPARFGSISRHYIRTTRDRAVPAGGQDHMIALVDRAMGNATQIHTLESDHSPFVSQPERLALILEEIAQSSARRASDAA